MLLLGNLGVKIAGMMFGLLCVVKISLYGRGRVIWLLTRSGISRVWDIILKGEEGVCYVGAGDLDKEGNFVKV